jgi:short-subunit dehydrogenase
MDIDAFKKFDLTGKTAVVTGGATGLGYYMTRGLMRSGAKVMMAARRENVLKEAAATLRTETKSGEVLYHTVDLNQRDTIKAFADHAIKTMGGVDIFIGNAGQDIFEAVDKITDPVIDQMFQVFRHQHQHVGAGRHGCLRRNKGRIECLHPFSSRRDWARWHYRQQHCAGYVYDAHAGRSSGNGGKNASGRGQGF